MTCSKNFGRLLQASCLGLIGMLAVAGCGGSETGNKDSGLPGGGDGSNTNVAALNLDRSAVNLGTIEVGSPGVGSVTVTNTGKLPSGSVIVTGSAGVTATGCTGALAAGASCTITITATPAVAGPFSGTVSITANPGATNPLVVSVIAVGGSNNLFSVSPGTIDLGNVSVGVAAPKQTITITAKVAISDLVVTPSGANVSVDKTASTCTAVLAANASCTVSVNFLAATPGSKSDAIVISGGGAAGKTVSVPVMANAQNPPKLVISPSTAQNLVASVGQTSSITFAVANSGDLPTGTITATVVGAATFTATNSCLILPSLGGCTITVAYKPIAVGAAAETATLTVTDTGAGASTVSVPLTGTAVAQSTLAITPATADLGAVLVGATGPSTVFTVTNKGGTASNAIAVTLSSTDFIITNDTCSGATLAAATGTCNISIALKPATVGPKLANLSVASAGGIPAVMTLNGAGITVATLSVTPAALDFGSVRLGRTGAAQTVTVKNNGGSATGALSFTKTGNFSVFPISSNTCSAPLAPAATCTFTVNFAPTDAGSQAAGYTVTDGATTGTVAVSGSGLAGAGLSIDQAPVVKECTGVSECEVIGTSTANALAGICFAKTVVGGTSNLVDFTVTAASLPAGMTDTGAITVALTGANADDFKVVTNSCTVPLLQAATCHVVLSFSPAAVGTRQASLTVTPANGGPASVTLQAVGQGLVEIVPMDADLEEQVTGLDFGQVPVLASNLIPPARRYMVVVRGPNTATAKTSSVLTTLLDPTTPADFSYPGRTTNFCNTASNEAVLLDFSLTATTNPPENQWCHDLSVFTCVFQVQFYPQTVKGARTATIGATGSGGGTDTKTLTGEATGPLLFERVAPVNFAAGFQVGDSTNAQVTSTIITTSNGDNVTTHLVNRSATADVGPVSLVLGGANADQFYIVNDRCSTTTLPHNGGECSVTIAFVPTSIGAKTATLTATAGGETATVVINAGATDSYNLTVTPGAVETAPYDFGTVPQTLGSEWVAFTVTNPAQSARSAQVGYPMLPSLPFNDNDGRFIIADGVNHARGTCGIPGTTSLAPGSSCTILVQFKPQAGDAVTVAPDTGYQGDFWVRDDAKAGAFTYAYLSGKVGSRLSITPAAYTFPNTAAGLTSAPTTLTVANLGSDVASLTIPSNTALAPFNVDQNSACVTNTQLAVGASCQLVVTFVGQVVVGGTYPINAKQPLEITANTAAASAVAKLEGNSVLPAKLVAVGFAELAGTNTNTINLGGVRKGNRSGNVTLTYKNTGSVPTDSIHFQWAGLATDVADSEFVIVTETATGCVGKTSLAAGATCTVTVNFAPSSTSVVGPRVPKLFVLSTAQAGLVDDFQFTAYALDPSSSGWTGTATPTLGFFAFSGMTPNPLTVAAPIQVFQLTNGTASAIATLGLGITALNGATAALEPSLTTDFELVTSGTAAGTTPCGTSLAASGQCTFAVRFHPTAYSADTVYRHAVVTASGLPGADMGVWGQVQSPAKLAITPTGADDEFAFGQVVIAQNATKSFTVTNSGETATSAAVAMTVSGPNASNFTVGGACNVVLASGATCTGTVTVAPGASLVSLNASLQATAPGISSSNAVPLSATGVLDTALVVSSPTMVFGAQAVGTQSLVGSNYVTLTNLTTARTSGLLTVTLADKTNFEIIEEDSSCLDLEDGDGDPRGLNGGEPCSVVVVFKPQTLGTGTFATTLTFTASPGGTQTVNITGTAISALKTDQTSPVLLAATATVTNPYTVMVYLESGAPETAYIRTSMSGSAYIIVEDTCVANKLIGTFSCAIKVAYVGGAVTPLKTGTLTINGGAPGYSASVVFNSTAPTP